MTPADDDWMDNPAPPPRAIGEPAHQAAKPKPARGTPKRKARLAAALRGAPVAAEPAPPGGDAAPEPAPAKPKGRKPAAGGGKGGDGGKGGSPPPPPPGDGDPPPRPSDHVPRPHGQIWPDCAVKALGVNGDYSYFLDRLGQLRATKELKAQAIVSIFGGEKPLLAHYPSYDRAGNLRRDTFNSQLCAFDMLCAAADKGLFHPDGAVRGVGAWRDDQDRLIYHTGGALLTPQGQLHPDLHDGRVYPAAPAVPPPAPSAEATGARIAEAAEAALDLFGTWSWTRPQLDPLITLGMLGCQMLGGALDWRPTFWVSGPEGSGKSTLLGALELLHGGQKGVVKAADATKMGILNAVKYSSLPVIIDELEPGDERSQREQDILTAMRIASSGAQWLRGSADQKGIGGNIYSTFLASSILIPGKMSAADRSRLIILEVRPQSSAPPLIEPAVWRGHGSILKRGLIDRWPAWRERLHIWRGALAELGLRGRGSDNWATVIAMADLMRWPDTVPEEARLREVAQLVAAAATTAQDEVGSNATDMVTHLVTQPFDVYRRGELWSVAQWLMVAACLPGAPLELIQGPAEGATTILDEDRRQAAKRANSKLARAGLRVIGEGRDAKLFLASGNYAELRKFFAGSAWANGVWRQAAQRLAGAEPDQRSLAGMTTRGTTIPFTSMPGLLAFPADRVVEPSPPTPEGWEEFA